MGPLLAFPPPPSQSDFLPFLNMLGRNNQKNTRGEKKEGPNEPTNEKKRNKQIHKACKQSNRNTTISYEQKDRFAFFRGGPVQPVLRSLHAKHGVGSGGVRWSLNSALPLPSAVHRAPSVCPPLTRSEEYSGWKTKVLCHDCERYTEVPYHFFYLKVGCVWKYVSVFFFHVYEYS